MNKIVEKHTHTHTDKRANDKNMNEPGSTDAASVTNHQVKIIHGKKITFAHSHKEWLRTPDNVLIRIINAINKSNRYKEDNDNNEEKEDVCKFTIDQPQHL